jgi:hypothetical protein
MIVPRIEEDRIYTSRQCRIVDSEVYIRSSAHTRIRNTQIVSWLSSAHNRLPISAAPLDPSIGQKADKSNLSIRSEIIDYRDRGSCTPKTCTRREGTRDPLPKLK